MFKSQTIANIFLEIAKEEGKKLTNMQVQKLVYFAHGWYLAFTDNALIDENVEAWTYGPVIPSVYEALQQYRANPVCKRRSNNRPLSAAV